MKKNIREIFSYTTRNSITLDNPKGISVEDLEKPKEDLLKLAKKINLSVGELIFKSNWYVYNGEYLYLKRLCSTFKIINEFLGEMLSEYMELPTIEYTLALNSSNVVGVLSRNFREKGKKYKLASEIKLERLKKFKEALEKDEITDLRMMLDRMLVKDFYSCLTDRFRNTLCSESRLGKVTLETAFDYEYSFVDERENLGAIPNKEEETEYDTYYSPLFVKKKELSGTSRDTIPITYDTLKAMMEYDEYLVNQYEKMMQFDMPAALNTIEQNNGIKIKQEITDYYINFDKSRKQKLEEKVRRIR